MRRDHYALRRGEYIPLHAEGDVFAYARWTGLDADEGEVVVTALHRNPDGAPKELELPVWPIGAEGDCRPRILVCTKTGGIGDVTCLGGTLKMTLPPGEAIVLELEGAHSITASPG